MAKNVVAGIDIGTQGTKTAFFDEHGTVLSETFEASQPSHGTEGSITEDPEKQLGSVINTLKNGLEKGGIEPSDVSGVAIDSQMAGIIGVGSNGKNITPYDSWLDTRCAPFIKEMETEAGGEVLQKTGCAPSINHGPKKLWWKHNHPEVYRNITSFVQPGAYAAMRLTGKDGNEAFIDKTYLHFSGFADNARSTWDEDLCRQFQFDTSKLPRIVEPHKVIGPVTCEMSALTGLQEGTPVVAGCGDTVASFISAGATSRGVCVDVAGTASVFCATVDQFKADTENAVLACGRSVIPELWYNYAYINGGGQNLEWFKDQISNILPDSRESIDFPALNRLAEEAGFSIDNPVFIPHLGGRVCPSQPWLRGAWLNLNWSHGVGHLYRSLLEGIALEYGIYLDITGKMHPELAMSELNVVGGGTNSGLWNQIKADVLGINVTKLQRSKGAPMGSAILAGYGVGLFNDIHDTVQQWIRREPALTPDPEKQKFYRKLIPKYSDFMDAINRITENEY